MLACASHLGGDENQLRPLHPEQSEPEFQVVAKFCPSTSRTVSITLPLGADGSCLAPRTQ